ncbi:hypothetical protein RNZ50_04995 [Paracoccaceae bacterium Fryx2]|nr:hypothetical protein [Paracoccaceae bacterium Fryx2]
MQVGISQDDQAALRARCAAEAGQGAGVAPSTQEGQTDPETAEGVQPDAVQPESDQAGATQAPSTTVTGSAAGAEVQAPGASAAPEPYTGLAGSTNEPDGRMVRICDLIRSL